MESLIGAIIGLVIVVGIFGGIFYGIYRLIKHLIRYSAATQDQYTRYRDAERDLDDLEDELHTKREWKP